MALKKDYCMQKLSIIIPAHNEALRIQKTLQTYAAFFTQLNFQLDVEFIVVLNGCTDNTIEVVGTIQQTNDSIRILNFKVAGKGLAIKQGFLDALTRPNDYIGFVDADMATSPEAFYDLYVAMNNHDGIIASRYMPGAKIAPARPLIKRWGCKLVYEPMVFALFGLTYKDFQCGAKLFKRTVIETVTPHMTVSSWAFDVELLYLCKRFGFAIKETPTQWHDQAGSKLRFSSGLWMHVSIVQLRLKHSIFKKLLS